MNRDVVLARAQAYAEAGMVDACTIRRRTGTAADDETGERTPTYAHQYTGKCRIQQATAMAQEHDSGEDRLLMLRLEVQLPVSVVGLQVEDLVEITASRDPDLVGRVFTVRDLAHKTDMSSRRVQCLERTSS